MEQLMSDHVHDAQSINLQGSKNPFAVILLWVRRNLILALSLLMPGFIVIEFLSLPSRAAIGMLKTANPATTAFMEERKKELEGRGRPSRIAQQWVSLSSISPDLIHAVLVAEDGTFYRHEGFDWYEIEESLGKNLNEGRLARGGSTITQQLVKNLFLSSSKDPLRKLKEAYLTMQIEKLLQKNRILELYLNIIEWGDGIFGVETAALQYFGKSALELSREESARLAAVIPSPLRHLPNGDSRYVKYRSQIILERMEARGW